MRSTSDILLAVTPDHYAPLYEYLIDKGLEPDPLGYPTVFMRDPDGDVRGLIATYTNDELVVAGRAVADSQYRLMMLFEVYEEVLKNAGITVYHVPVDKTKKGFVEIIRRLFGEPYLEDATNIWFRRDVRGKPN